MFKRAWKPRYKVGDIVWVAPFETKMRFAAQPVRATILQRRTNPVSQHADGYVVQHDIKQPSGITETETVYIPEVDIIGVVEADDV